MHLLDGIVSRCVGSFFKTPAIQLRNALEGDRDDGGYELKEGGSP